MKNPLNRRMFRDLKDEFGKYAVIFIFVCGMIAIVSGFLVANDSMVASYNESFEKYNIEDGNFELYAEAGNKLINDLEKEKVSVYENYYVEEETSGIDSTLRIFKPRTEINRVCIMSGEMPKDSKEIAIDRMYADNNKLTVGDILTVGGNKLKITGLVALSDYSALYSSPSDMMFDAMKFGVAIMTSDGFDSFGISTIHYNYSWKYDNAPKNSESAKNMSEELIELLSEKSSVTKNAVINYIPEYENQAIIFAGDDLTRDSMMFTVFLYIIMAIIAFVFAIMTSNTISKEANVIGTLRASGYTKGELVCHYMSMPAAVIFLAAIIGNILGYTWLKDYMADMYYGSYSLTTYVTLWNADAFIRTTLVPVIIMLIINFTVLESKLSLSPLKFIRRDLSRKPKKKAFPLNTGIGIMHRFRIRVIFQNIPNYITIFIGIFFANVVLLFGLALAPLLLHFQNEITENMLSEYQYLLKLPQETNTIGAEKFCAYSLDTIDEKLKSEGVSVYGIDSDSEYVNIDLGNGVYISNAYSEKFGLNKGDTVTMKEKYGSKKYTFKIDGIYYYPSAVAVFMSRPEFTGTFEKDVDYYNGYFSDNEITDIDEAYIATKITRDDLTKTSRQMIHSMGNMTTLFVGFGVIMFILIIYLLSKIIIEKNTQSISMTKILGYTGGEISGLYIMSTAIVVAVSLLVTIPLGNLLMSWVVPVAMSEYSGWLPYYVPIFVFVRMGALGISSYAVIAALQFLKISRIPKGDALKNVE